MHVETRHTKAAGAYARWVKQYSRLSCHDKTTIAEALKVLGRTPSPDAVDAVIGNTCWTRLVCDECNASVDAVVVLGDVMPEDDDHTWGRLCGPCLRLSLALLEGIETP